jgi:hypothetical protein
MHRLYTKLHKTILGFADIGSMEKFFKKISVSPPRIVTVCVFVGHLFSFYPFYFDFHSARIIFDVSSGFYLWNINKTTA